VVMTTSCKPSGRPRRPLTVELADLSSHRRRCALRAIVWRCTHADGDRIRAAEAFGVAAKSWERYERGSTPTPVTLAALPDELRRIWHDGELPDDPTIEEAQEALDAWWSGS
jgi:hypothetical protein